MAHLFGTDGVRGKAGEFPLDVATIRRLGAALVRALRHDGATTTAIRFLAGRDTRESGEWIERELAFGIRSQGGSYTSTGVVPTPAIAYLTPRLGYSAGVVISASHNPFEDNGIKVFSGAGEKFTETLERHVESIIADTSWSVAGDAAEPVEELDLRSEYLDHLRDRAFERFHTTTKQAALIAQKAGVKKLLIGHFSSKYDTLEEFEAEAREVFPNTELALEGVTYKV